MLVRTIKYFLLLIISFLLSFNWLYASQLLLVSDKVTNHAVGEYSDHLIQFTSPSGVQSAGQTIEIHFPNDFDLSAITVNDIDLSHGPTGIETEEVLANTASNNVWGVSIDLLNNDIIFTSPTNAGVNEIANNDIVQIEIGLNANGGINQIKNPNVEGSYPVYIDGSFGDYGFFALWVGNTSVGINANLSNADTIAPTVQVLLPNGGEEYYIGDDIEIKWTANDNIALNNNSVAIYYSINDGLSWVLVANNLANTGSYIWHNNSLISDFVKVRVSIQDTSSNIGQDDSDGFFKIKRRSGGGLHPYDDGSDVESYTESQERIPTIDGGWAYPGDLVKCPEYSTVYFYGFDGYRHYFPTESVFKTWYYDFSEVKIVKLEDLVKLRLGRNIKVRPGNVLVKVPTYPAVYAVGKNSDLYHIKNEEIAKKLYGPDWKNKIIDIPVVFWGDYKIVGELDSSFYPDGTLIKYPNDARVYLLENQKKRWFVNEDAFYANHYYWRNIIEIDRSHYYPDGENIVYRESNLINLVYESY